MKLWQIDLSYACAGIVATDEGVVEHTAPIFQWMNGKTISGIARWVQKKHGTLRKVD